MCSVSDEVYLVMDRVIYAIVRRYGREKSGVRAGVSHMSLFRAAANTLGSPEELASQGCCGTDLRWGPPSFAPASWASPHQNLRRATSFFSHAEIQQ